MKFSIITVLLLGLFQTVLQAQSREDLVRKHITYLASDALEGRAPGTKGEKLAQEYIVQAFTSYGLKPAGSNKFYQPFDYTERSHAHHAEGKGIERKGSNVIGYLDNNAQKTIIIGAHYDHLGNEDGRGSSLAADPNGQIHNGADDNASGIAGLLELARIYTQNNVKENANFLFMAYSAEEAGLIGSKHYTQNPVKPLNQVLCMINMDMIGRLRDSSKSLIIGGVGTSPIWIPMVKKLNSEFELKFDTAGMGPSDHASFYLKDIPVLHFFSGTHNDYHKPTDDIEKINFPGEVKIVNYIRRVVDSCAGMTSIPFTKTKSNERKMTAFKVTLGIMADYSFGGPGVKVDGVSPEKPAEKAGILAGDLILKIGEFETADIYKYMEALGKFEKGQKVEVELKRGGSVLKKEVVF
ncbi:MAG TPA: M20/M25/M40 family metallo-hydrolase [Catalimonadaceae bacterium]|nr:M20/M25/M40 family metallo-hydrolase [Catalimonadaceae bacterium]